MDKLKEADIDNNNYNNMTDKNNNNNNNDNNNNTTILTYNWSSLISRQITESITAINYRIVRQRRIGKYEVLLTVYKRFN